MTSIARGEVENFLFHEAGLLDEWRLEEWLALLTDDVRYLVPSLDSPDSDPSKALFMIADDRKRLESRVGQLLSKIAWAENPRSRTRRLITNIRVLTDEGGITPITANFAVWRFHGGQTDVYVGRYLHRLQRGDTGLLIRERKVVLDLDTLRPHGKLSFIL
jgi:p-cumate 2,3-dioxygenase beta subunit